MIRPLVSDQALRVLVAERHLCRDAALLKRAIGLPKKIAVPMSRWLSA